MLTETRNAAVLNHFSHNPEIASELGTLIDFSSAIRETNVFLFGEHGGFLFEWTAPRTYEVHVMLTRAGRGKWGFAAAQEGLRLISERADRLWARVDPKMLHLAFYTRKAGFREVEPVTLYLPEPKRWRIFEWSK